MPRKQPTYEQAVDQLAQLLTLDDDAILMAQGYSVLPDRLKRHIKLLIDDYISGHNPTLRDAYGAVSHDAQLRFNRIIEEHQARARKGGADDH